jgi:glucose-1-phosphate thymidylyltransferase
MIDQLKPSQRGELEITEAIQLLINNGYNVGHQLVEGWWKDTGTPEDILESNRLLLDELKHEVKGIVEDDATIQGRILLEDGAVIKREALVRGPTVIGKNTIIEKSAYIDPYTSIGNNVVIKKGEIGNSIIMDDCYIDIEEKITDSIIGARSRISMKQRAPKGHSFIVGEGSKIDI